MKKTLFCALTLAFSGYAAADTPSGFYSGASISRWQYSQLAPDADAHLETLDVNAGFWFHPLLSAEVRAGTGLGDQATNVSDRTWELGLDYYGSVYWRPEVGNERAKLYGLLGYSHVEMTAQVPGTGINAGTAQEFDLSEGGPSFGVGIGFFYNQQVTLNLEWRQLADTEGFELSGYTAGFDYRF